MNKKQKTAKTLYFQDLKQIDIATKVGVTERTLYNWIEKFSWEEERKALSSTKENVLGKLYEALNTLLSDAKTVAQNTLEIERLTKSIERVKDKEADFVAHVQVFTNFSRYLHENKHTITPEVIKAQDIYLQEKFIKPAKL